MDMEIVRYECACVGSVLSADALLPH